jgi:small subunit ribosomal protein S1
VPWPDEEPLVVGQHLELRITSIVNFGAFLKLPDGREGLLHVTEMYPKHQRGDIPHRPGDILRVVVASIDAERGRISFTQEPLTE